MYLAAGRDLVDVGHPFMRRKVVCIREYVLVSLTIPHTNPLRYVTRRGSKGKRRIFLEEILTNISFVGHEPQNICEKSIQKA